MSLESIFVLMFLLSAIGLSTVFATVWWLITQLNRVDDDFEKRPFGGFPKLGGHHVRRKTSTPPI